MSYKLATNILTETERQKLRGSAEFPAPQPLVENMEMLLITESNQQFVTKTCIDSSYLRKLLAYGQNIGKELNLTDKEKDTWLFD